MVTAHYNKEEFAQRGDSIYDTQIHPLVHPEDNGKYVLIDIDSGEYEMDTDEIAASDRLLARRPNAQVWLVRVGSRFARRFATGRRG
jgi:hypothetical protein